MERDGLPADPMQQLAQSVKQRVDRFEAALRAGADGLRRAFEDVAERLREPLAAMERAASFMRSELPARTRDQLGTLAKNGWYLDPEMSIPDIADLAEAFASESVADVETALCDHFDEALDQIQSRLVAQHPERRTVLGAAFDAHRAQNYILSVPVLLAQADGMIHDMVSKRVFSRAPKKRLTESAISALVPDLLGASFLAPLAMDLPITATPGERANFPGALNRHAVLHGEDVSYGTRINGCRAVSLVSYTSLVHQVVTTQGKSI